MPNKQPPLAKFGSLEWVACTSPAPLRPKKKSPAPAPEKPKKPAYLPDSVHLWTQTPPGGLPPPPEYKAVETKPEEKPVEKKDEQPKVVGPKRKSRYWKRFYRENLQLLVGAYDPELWATFSGLVEDTEEPRRSKWLRRQFRKHPEFYGGYHSPFDSDDDSDSDFPSDMDSDSDTDSEDDMPSGPSRKTLNFNRRRQSVARSERIQKFEDWLKQKESSSEASSDSTDHVEKHVHFSDEETKLKPILKKPTSVERPNAVVKKPEPTKVKEVVRQQPASQQSRYQQSSSPRAVINVYVDLPGQSPASKQKAVDEGRAKAAPENNASCGDKTCNKRDNHPKSQSFFGRGNHNSRNSSSPPQNFDNTLSSSQSYSRSTAYFPSEHFLPHVSPLFRYRHDAPQLTDSLSSYPDYIYRRNLDCYIPAKPERECWYFPHLGKFRPARMEGSGKSRCILPVQAQVLVIEHLLEIPSDPRPNAFYDSRTNCLRVYHGNVYGNPNTRLMPVHTEEILHSALGAGATGGIGSFGAPIGPFTMGPQPGVMQPPPGPIKLPNGLTYLPSTGPGGQPVIVREMDPRLVSAVYPDIAARGYIPGMGYPMGGGAPDPVMEYAARTGTNPPGMSPIFSTPSYVLPHNEHHQNNHNHQNNNNGGGNYGNGKGNANGNGNGNNHNGNNNNNRNVSHQSRQSSNHNQNQGNRSNHGQNQSRQPSRSSNTGNQNNNNNFGSNSGNNNGSSGNNNSGNDNDGWDDDNNDSWGNNNNNIGTSASAPAPPSPSPTVIHHQDGDRTPTRSHVHIPGAYPDSAQKNDNNDSGYGNSNDNSYDNGGNNNNDNGGTDKWGNDIVDLTPSNDDDEWGNDTSNNNSNNNNGEQLFNPTNETEFTTGSWKSNNNTPTNKRKSSNNQNRGNNNGYNLKQTNANGNSNNSQSWGDPNAAQSTGGAGGW